MRAICRWYSVAAYRWSNENPIAPNTSKSLTLFLLVPLDPNGKRFVFLLIPLMTERPFLGVNGLSINMFFFNESDTCLNRPDASFQDSKFPLNKISGTSRSRIANCEELRIKYSNNKNIVYLRCVGIFVSGKCLTFLI